MIVKRNISIDELLSSCLQFSLILLLQQLSDKNIATIVEMGFSVQQATTALQHAGGSLDTALNSLLPSDEQNSSASGLVARETAAVASSSSTSNGLAHRSDRADTRARHQPSDSSRNDRSGMAVCTYITYVTCTRMCSLVTL